MKTFFNYLSLSSKRSIISTFKNKKSKKDQEVNQKNNTFAILNSKRENQRNRDLLKREENRQKEKCSNLYNSKYKKKDEQNHNFYYVFENK